MSSRVTLNYGLRWEPFFPQQLENGAVYQFDRGFQQNVKSTVFPNAPPGLYFPGDPGFPTQGGDEKAVGAISDRAWGSPGIRPALAARTCAPPTANPSSS